MKLGIGTLGLFSYLHESPQNAIKWLHTGLFPTFRFTKGHASHIKQHAKMV